MTDRGEQFRVVCVLATDWSYYESTLPRHHEFESYEAMVVGFVIKETEDELVLAHQVFDNGKIVRHTTVITKSSILEQFDMVIQTQAQGD